MQLDALLRGARCASALALACAASIGAANALGIAASAARSPVLVQDEKPAVVPEASPPPASKPAAQDPSTPPVAPPPNPTGAPRDEPSSRAAQAGSAPANPLARPEVEGAPSATDYAQAWSEPAFEAELTRLAAAYPSRLQVSSLGTSKQGRRIALLTLGDRTGDPDLRPAALLATDLEARFHERPGGPEAGLYTVRALLERAEQDPELAELFTGATLYAVPAPDPDGVFEAGGPVARTCRLERNFPAGWQPSDAIDCPQGPYPCSEPETRELARLVAQRTNIGALALFARRLGDAATNGDTEANGIGTVESALAHLAARAGLEAGALARARDAALAQPGGLAAFARARAGACVLVLDPWSGDPAPAEGVRASFAALPAAVEALLRELPRLAGHSVRAERLREKLWLVEVELQVAGGLPTASAEERARAPASVWLDVQGARVSKIGLRRDGQPVGNLDVPRGKTWRIGHLAGNESVRLYLAVEGEEGGTLSLAFRSLRGGHVEFDVPLGG
jgi:hypothetical protein